MKTTIKHFGIYSMGIILFLCAHDLSAQKIKQDVYKVWIKLVDDNTTKSGYLYQVNSDAIVISKKYKKINESQLISITSSNIKTLRIKKSGKGGEGALIGAGIGLGLGALIGFASKDESDSWVLPMSKTDKAIFMGTALSVVGAMTGAIVNSKKTKYNIYGDTEKYQNVAKMIENYQIINN